MKGQGKAVKGQGRGSERSRKGSERSRKGGEKTREVAPPTAGAIRTPPRCGPPRSPAAPADGGHEQIGEKTFGIAAIRSCVSRCCFCFRVEAAAAAAAAAGGGGGGGAGAGAAAAAVAAAAGAAAAAAAAAIKAAAQQRSEDERGGQGHLGMQAADSAAARSRGRAPRQGRGAPDRPQHEVIRAGRCEDSPCLLCGLWSLVHRRSMCSHVSAAVTATRCVDEYLSERNARAVKRRWKHKELQRK